MSKVVVTSALRTPFGKLGGNLAGFSGVELGSMAIEAAMKRIDMHAETVDELIMGAAMLVGGTSVAARQMLFKAGLLETTPSLTIDRACCSSMTAVGLGMKNILLGEAETVVAGGFESMSQTPHLVRDARWGNRLGDLVVEDPLKIRNPITNTPVALVTGEKALEYGVDREEQDQWAFASHQKYFAAFEAGKFEQEILPVEVPQAKGASIRIQKDESPRQNTSIEKLRQLKTVYDSPTITAGNAPGLNDGAAALILMSENRQNELGLDSLASIEAYTNLSGDPSSSVCMPGLAIRKALNKAGLKWTDLKRIEINEAFAAMPLVSTRIITDGDKSQTKELRSITNVNGGAVAIGHPTGASGARVIMTLIYELRRLGGGIGAAAICGGYGQSDAVIVKVE